MRQCREWRRSKLSFKNFYNINTTPLDRLIEINRKEDIPAQYQNSPLGDLLEYHDLDRPFDSYTNAQILIGMCMDNRKHLHIPDNFAFIIRSGGANLRYAEFKVSYAIAIGNLQHIAIIGHNNCGMVHLEDRKELFIEGLMRNAGWSREQAERHFTEHAPKWEIGNEIDFTISEAVRLRKQYPKMTVAPMLYSVESNKIKVIAE